MRFLTRLQPELVRSDVMGWLEMFSCPVLPDRSGFHSCCIGKLEFGPGIGITAMMMTAMALGVLTDSIAYF